MLLSVGAILAAASALVVRAVVRRGLRPLSTLVDRAQRIDASSLQLRFPFDDMPAELLPIVLRLNDLLARMESSFARERRFSADVAHELRTPIAELRTLAEVALKWPDDNRHALQDALAIALQMESIATGLLTLARCEGSLLPMHPENVSLGALFREVYQPLEAKARAKELTVSLDVPSDAYWLTDRVMLRSIFHNLLFNAVDHSQPASAIKARMERNGAGERLWISNTNTGLSPQDLPHLFDRFWQKESARSSPTIAASASRWPKPTPSHSA